MFETYYGNESITDFIHIPLNSTNLFIAVLLLTIFKAFFLAVNCFPA